MHIDAHRCICACRNTNQPIPCPLWNSMPPHSEWPIASAGVAVVGPALCGLSKSRRRQDLARMVKGAIFLEITSKIEQPYLPHLTYIIIYIYIIVVDCDLNLYYIKNINMSVVECLSLCPHQITFGPAHRWDVTLWPVSASSGLSARTIPK